MLTIFKQISNIQLLYSLRAIDRQTSLSQPYQNWCIACSILWNNNFIAVSFPLWRLIFCTSNSYCKFNFTAPIASICSNNLSNYRWPLNSKKSFITKGFDHGSNELFFPFLSKINKYIKLKAHLKKPAQKKNIHNCWILSSEYEVGAKLLKILLFALLKIAGKCCYLSQ